MLSGLALSLILVVVSASAPAVGVVTGPLGALGLYLAARRAEPQVRSVWILSAQIALVAFVVALVVGAVVILR
ncbi:hypothetical protein D1871_20570 [Nakamurella silvestris]|nr:hypothetical protein D1871_20570 [Nakamurella silvestris]